VKDDSGNFVFVFYLFNFLRKEDLRVDKGFIVLNSGFVTLFSEENIPLIKDFRMLIFVNIADL
jgi:hypothetical protein